ncbi:hypothetical protein CASFOL_023508 [Castilleja foliolosa]|uniref:VWFA domain-containing protein n=1 Tax=Castilleja foliolosa TaxID=1961234 RepID=A0ABD3CLW5_9LAMI
MVLPEIWYNIGIAVVMDINTIALPNTIGTCSSENGTPVISTQPNSDGILVPDVKQYVSITAIPEFDAVAASETKDDFKALIRLRAPPLSEEARRAPVDLVMVLDISSSMGDTNVSGSMAYTTKLDLLKRAACFVIDQMDHSDRLSIVSFQSVAKIELALLKMTEQGRAAAKRVVNSLIADGGTVIVEGLTMGVQVLQTRLHPNPVASILFLSDGQDSYNRQPSDYLPPLIVSGTDKGHQTVPIHAFGFGADHNPLVMNAIADLSGGTFSFIELYELVQDAFARCIGGLLSVVVRELRLTLRSASQGVAIKLIPSGRHFSEISDGGSRGTIDVGDLYADEEKEFLVNICVPVCANNNERTTPLLDIMCSYIDELSSARVQMESCEIRRPVVPLLCDVKVKLEVDRQKSRLDAVDGLAEAQRVADTGDLEGARAILSKRIKSVQASASRQAGDGLLLKLEDEMKQTEEKMGSKATYERAGRAYVLSSISSHANQRATTSGKVASSNDAYVTPNMANMVNKSQQLVQIEYVKVDEC